MKTHSIAFRAKGDIDFVFCHFINKLTLFIKNFDGFVKYNDSVFIFIKNYFNTQYDAENMIGYKLAIEKVLSFHKTRVLSKWEM